MVKHLVVITFQPAGNQQSANPLNYMTVGQNPTPVVNIPEITRIVFVGMFTYLLFEMLLLTDPYPCSWYMLYVCWLRCYNLMSIISHYVPGSFN